MECGIITKMFVLAVDGGVALSRGPGGPGGPGAPGAQGPRGPGAQGPGPSLCQAPNFAHAPRGQKTPDLLQDLHNGFFLGSPGGLSGRLSILPRVDLHDGMGPEAIPSHPWRDPDFLVFGF